MESNFEKIESYEANLQDTDYDFDSIMQYGTTAFTVNGENTMEDKFDENRPLGNKKLSDSDVIELNLAYQCHCKLKTFFDRINRPPIRIRSEIPVFTLTVRLNAHSKLFRKEAEIFLDGLKTGNIYKHNNYYA